MIFIARFLFALMLLFTSAAQAAQPLIFKSSTSDIRALSVLTFLQEAHGFTPAIPYGIAAIDLNNDGVDEWIVRQDKPGCVQDANCPFFVVGLSQKKPRLLGDVSARKIGITDEKSYGVSHLVVYNDPNDDFTYKSYSWDPFKGRFQLP